MRITGKLRKSAKEVSLPMRTWLGLPPRVKKEENWARARVSP
jgi:hypothetical protein